MSLTLVTSWAIVSLTCFVLLAWWSEGFKSISNETTLPSILFFLILAVLWPILLPVLIIVLFVWALALVCGVVDRQRM